MKETNMDKETIAYIRNYFSHLMTEDEVRALKHYMYIEKSEDNPRMRDLMIERGWISDKKEVIELLKDGYEAFELRMAGRIMQESPEKVFLNNCPECHKLARTPHAKQCRHCGHRWRESG